MSDEAREVTERQGPAVESAPDSIEVEIQELDAKLAEHQARVASHQAAREDTPYAEQRTYMRRVTTDFITGVVAAHYAFTRYPDGGTWLLSTFVEDFLESPVSIEMLAHNGVFNVGRRELRYLLEAAVKRTYVDEVAPPGSSLNDRLTLLHNDVPRSSVDVIDALTLRMLPDADEFRSAVKSAFGALSGYTHPSRKQLDERLARAAGGQSIGFETAETLRPFNRVLFQVYDLVLTLIFEGIGPAFTGDLFIQAFDDERTWKFHKGRFVRLVSQHFDYKAERQQPR
ncbi:hypothetical protein E0H75_07160 [Kribbella capetownensis]|uniref:Uncharacterized protein n=1 Tax=Kribbella capetownensis TaxID=1572659 RepID=A0A4V2M900_9ACTN|nr:hypothetical protein [Kribbella capetownensis]TCC53462.1 hypothetical protein E0H75_07160 [Kribbella capetownensis]